MLETKHFSGATSPVWTSSDISSGAVLRQVLGPNKEIGLRFLAAFALNGLDHKRRDVARTQFRSNSSRSSSGYAGVESFPSTGRIFVKLSQPISDNEPRLSP